MKIKWLCSVVATFLFQTLQLNAQTDTTNVENKTILDEIVVTGNRYETDVRHLSMTLSVLNRTKITQSHTPSLLPVLTEQVPGLFITSRGIMGYGISGGAAGGMSIRGLSGGTARMMVLIDGHPQYMGFMGHPISDAYQSVLTERVEVLRGPASVLYGSNAMGGVINIVTRKTIQEGMNTDVNVGYGSYNTLQAEATNRFRKGNFSSVVSASYNRTDGHRTDMEFEQLNGYLKLGYELNPYWSTSADVNLMHFKASQPGSLSAPLIDADQRITRGMASVAIRNRYETTSGALSFFYNWGRHKINDGYNPNDGESPLDFRFNSSDKMMGVSWNQSLQLFTGNRMTIGMDWYHFGGKAWNEFVEGKQKGERAEIVDETQDEWAGYLDFRQQIAYWLTINAALRVDYHTQSGTEWIPQVGTSIHLPRKAELKLSVARGFRHPIIREMFMWGAANPNLKAETLWNYELGFSQRLWESRLSYGINLFYIQGDNMIVTVPVDGRMKNLNTGRIENKGVELQTTYRFTPTFSIDANYSYLYMKYPVIGSPTHKLYAGLSYNKKSWIFSSGVQYVSGLYKSVEPEETENFVLWNANVSYQLCKWSKFWVKVENILAQHYEVMKGYPMPKTTFMGGISLSF
ncbi:MAG: TonB-dependent receptor [Mediterranea massiliensis]|nr:TonB-dependent receptor [Mediterranea massiliensis]